MRRWRAANKEKNLEYQRRYFSNLSPEKKVRYAAADAEYKKANSSEIGAKKKVYWANRRMNEPDLVARQREYHRAWDKDHADRRRALRSDPVKKAKRAAYGAAWTKANPDKHAAKCRSRRARIAGASGTHNAAQVRAIMRRQGGACVYCKVDASTGYHVDHIVPLILGGANDHRNLQILCPPCNLAKATKHPIDFAQSIGMLL